MECPNCHNQVEQHNVRDANLCAGVLDNRSYQVRTEAAQQISEWEAASRVLKRRIVREREQSFT